MNFDAVLFDLDGLLLDTERPAIASGRAALAEFGHDVPEEVMMGLLGIDNATGIARLSDHLGVDLDVGAVDAAWGRQMTREIGNGVPLRPGAAEIVAHLTRARVPFAVATNSQTGAALEKLARSGLAGRIPVVLGVDQVERGKPAPDVYLAAAARLGVAAARCLVFEDSDIGVRAGRAAGATVVQIPDLVPAREDRAHHSAPSLLEGAAWAGIVAEA